MTTHQKRLESEPQSVPYDTEAQKFDVAGIYREHADFVWRCIRRMGISDTDTGDLVHDVFVIVHQKLDSFEGRSDVKTWLYAIAQNLVWNERRKQSNRKRLWQRFVNGHQTEAEANIDLDGNVYHTQLAKAADIALNTLDDPFRGLMMLVDFEGVSIREAGAAYNMSKDAAWGALRVARKRFSAALPSELRRDHQTNATADAHAATQTFSTTNLNGGTWSEART